MIAQDMDHPNESQAAAAQRATIDGQAPSEVKTPNIKMDDEDTKSKLGRQSNGPNKSSASSRDVCAEIRDAKVSTKEDFKNRKNQQSTMRQSKQEVVAAQVGRQSSDSQPASFSSKTHAGGRRAQQKNNTNSSSSSQHDARSSTVRDQPPSNNVVQVSCNTLDEFSRRAQEIKQDIYDTLEKQSKFQLPDQPIEIVQLKNDILKLSVANETQDDSTESAECAGTGTSDGDEATGPTGSNPSVKSDSSNETYLSNDCALNQAATEEVNDRAAAAAAAASQSDTTKELAERSKTEAANQVQRGGSTAKQQEEPSRNDETQSKKIVAAPKGSPPKGKKDTGGASGGANERTLVGFEPLSAKLDSETKYVSLISSLRKNFEGSPEMLEPICSKLVQMSDLIGKLELDCENYNTENKKLQIMKQKLENLCRELQKSNNAIRIESLDLIKLEQGKAKEQTTKIQSTLSGVIKLFDENQQRNMSLRQENQELQTKLKSLLEHCDNWEKGVGTALRQKDIENRLLKTELAKANLLKNEEREKFLKEKQDLLQLLSMMQEQQSRIEGQEAKLRSDLSSYASKYDECQAVISKGMSKFQTESKRMLKQIESSRQDYKVLLSKYETSNKRMAQLLEEKQRWIRSTNVANKKIETLEKLCRALRDHQNDDARKENAASQGGAGNGSSSNRANRGKKAPITNKPPPPPATNQQQFGPADSSAQPAAATRPKSDDSPESSVVSLESVALNEQQQQHTGGEAADSTLSPPPPSPVEAQPQNSNSTTTVPSNDGTPVQP